MRIAINGFGRIGRTFLRTVLEDPASLAQIEVVAINIGPAPMDAVAYAFKYDTVLGTFPGRVVMRGNQLYIGDYVIPIISEVDPIQVDWKHYSIDWVIESSGAFTDREGALKHLKSGACSVLITAPSTGEDITIIPGINEEAYNATEHHIVSLGSCTTNALLPMLSIINNSFGIDHGFMTTIHAYTSSQKLLDNMDKKLRRGRAAALNIIPTTTGATKVLGKILPELSDRIGGFAVRVPVAKGSLIDLTISTTNTMTVETIHEAFRTAIADKMGGIVATSPEPLVSSDICGNNHSVIIDELSTDVVRGKNARILGWYDNEWGYCQRIKDFLLYIVGG